MKSIEVFCASPASTAICSSMDQRSITRPGLKPMDRHNRSTSSNTAPCSSHLPLDPSKPINILVHRKTSSSSITCMSNDSLSSSNEDNISSKNSSKQLSETLLSRKSSARFGDDRSDSLLSDKPYMDFIFDSERTVLQLSSRQPNSKEYPCNNNYKRMVLKSLSNKSYENPLYKKGLDIDGGGADEDDDGGDGGANRAAGAAHEKSSSSSSSLVSLSDHLNVQKCPSSPAPPSSNHRVVELTVSIHCKGCEHKLRKHISRMEGVTSFSIDLELKKVTVIGNVTPLGVLTSISKVMKYAQLL